MGVLDLPLTMLSGVEISKMPTQSLIGQLTFGREEIRLDAYFHTIKWPF